MPIVDNQGVKIHYQVEGEGPPLIIQYGFMDTLEQLYTVGYVESLKDYYKLILIDLRGHGKSDKPHDSSLYSMKHLTSDVIAVMDDLKIEKAHFMGYSMGGLIGFGLTQYYPDRFSSYILGGISPQPFSDEIRSKGNRMTEVLKGGYEGYIAFLESLGDEITDEVEEEVGKMDFKALYAFWTADSLSENEGFYREVNVPIMLYIGEEDGWGHYPRAKEFTHKTKNVTLYSFPDVGHELHFNVDMVVPSVIEFLKNI